MNPGNNPFTNLFSQQSDSGNANLFSNNNNSLFGNNSPNSLFGTNNNFNLFGDTPDNPNSNEKKENNKDINPFLKNQKQTSNNDKEKDSTKKIILEVLYSKQVRTFLIQTREVIIISFFQIMIFQNLYLVINQKKKMKIKDLDCLLK